jgi:hypothetical protein
MLPMTRLYVTLGGYAVVAARPENLRVIHPIGAIRNNGYGQEENHTRARL